MLTVFTVFLQAAASVQQNLFPLVLLRLGGSRVERPQEIDVTHQPLGGILTRYFRMDGLTKW